MVEVQQAFSNLRDTISETVKDLETWKTLDDVRSALGLPIVGDPSNYTKYEYMRGSIDEASKETIKLAAHHILTAYPGNRGQPSEHTLQVLQDNLWWIESNGIQRISKVCRYNIADKLDGVRFWGRLTPTALFSPIFTGGGISAGSDSDGYLYRYSYSGQGQKISVVKYLEENKFLEWPDQRFYLLLERLVQPEIQPNQEQSFFVEQFNELLKYDNFELRPEELQGGRPVYKLKTRASGVSGPLKYIIFGSSLKPDIVVDDALNMDIRNVGETDQCLLYDELPPEDGLTWKRLVYWWMKQPESSAVGQQEARKELGKRLQTSLSSEAEKIFFATYFTELLPKLGDRLPALLPQVHLHYDPRHRNERRKSVFARQRMDFLMLLRNSARIVIEIDGMHHYSSRGRADPKLYAQMVSEDRRIRNLGYEVYRFGGSEIVKPLGDGLFVRQENTTETIASFFESLLIRHRAYDL